jgi:hypothetical protein
VNDSQTEFTNSLKIGYTYREDKQPCGLYLSPNDRSTHIYVIGSSGVGKSKALATWILDDIEKGRGCGVIDPHGDLIRDILSYLPLQRLNRIILVDLNDPEYIVGFNPLELQKGIDPFTQTLELVEIFRKIWDLSDATTPRLLEILRNSIYTLIEAGGTVLDIEPLLTNENFRNEKIKYVKSQAVASFWRNRFARWAEKDRVNYVESTLNKVSTFTSDPRIQLMLSSQKSTINFRDIMDFKKVILINISKGVLRTNSYLLGALFVGKIQMAAMSRENPPLSQRTPFYFYVDEFQNYSTFSFAEILSEARKYGLSLTLVHQSLAQLEKELREIILGNAKNFVCFRLDRKDAELLVKYITEIDPFAWVSRKGDTYKHLAVVEQWELGINDLVDLPTQTAILKTKTEEPRCFYTYTLPESDLYEENLEKIRKANYEFGYTKKLKELDEALILQTQSIYEPDEPESFKE